MLTPKPLNRLLVVLMLASLLLGASGLAPVERAPSLLGALNSNVLAAPAGPTDETQVPHYFGPNPNWANSPFTLPDAQVLITGNGSGAAAVATVGANGIITAITVTNPGSGYSNAKVDILGSGTGATADVTIVKKGAVVAVTVDTPGTGYTAPVVSFSSGTAAATAYGGVENNIQIISGGLGYTMPTVDFDMPDAPDGVQATGHAEMDANGTITAIVVDTPGSGYLTAPGVAIHNGTLFDPILGETQATATSTLFVDKIVLDAFGANYNNPPTVLISDATGTGTGATATALLDNGIISAITLKKPGSGYITAGGIKKFTDPLPGLCDPSVPGSCPDWAANPAAKAIPLAVPAKVNYNGIEADQYEIGLVQYRTNFSSSLKDPLTLTPVGTLVRGYVQLAGAPPCAAGTFELFNAPLDPTATPVSTGYCGLTPPQYLGPVIAATKDKPVRIIFRNLLPKDAGGDLFLPTDSTLMGSGMADVPMFDLEDLSTVTDQARNPLCTLYPKSTMCFKDNRATLHLHGGITPWISDGTPHQWITPAGEGTGWPQGVSVSNVPDMAAAGCDGTTDGCMTFYYTNQQSARLMFYHDHAWGITRLNVYAGEAAGYLISDDTEKKLMAGPLASVGLGIPLVIQDKTFVPQDTQMYNQVDTDTASPTFGQVTSYGQDPTWDASRWGGYGNFWFHHVYMPAQNPGDPSGMSAYGRWMYGPWFWPPALATKYPPIPNPYYNMDPKGPDGIRGTIDDWTTPLAVPCNLDDPLTHQYDTDPFCEPELIPGTPLISTGMEQFNDTPIVNGVAYPTVTLEPKAYRFRILSAANDRFFNFQWYVGDPTTADAVLGPTEVALNPAEVAAAQTDPVVFPTPDLALSPAGPDWIQIGTEGGFLPAPVVVDGQQVTTWITDPTRFDVGNVDKHSLLLAPAERADVIVDFSAFAGQTLILYNDAPAAFPARVPSYDYYTGAPDLSPVGAPAILPGYGPNTRTIMQVKIANTAPAPAFNLTALRNAFSHKADGSGVFESGQHPIIVGQAPYNSAYGTSFAASSNCNAPNSTLTRCDGLVRINDTSVFGFNTLKAPNAKMTMPLQPKAIHDEMNSTTFDEFGRMQANLGIEAQPPTPGLQNVTLYPYVNPQTELIDATNLPKNDVLYDANGLPVSDVKITAISDAGDGSQIWRITHNGVDTHPIHFHLYDVQVLNRVAWDNNLTLTDATELGWKDTVRISPLQDTIVALRPIIPELPWELPNAVRYLSPMMSAGSVQFFNNIDPQGNPTAAITNQLVNFGWEYVYHCHILTHEEMDMMRPVSVAMPPVTPDGLVFDRTTKTLTWNDNSIAETAYVVQRSTDGGTTWTDVGTDPSPLDVANTAGSVRSLADPAYDPLTNFQYRVVAKNTVGYLDGADVGFQEMTVQSVSAPLDVKVLPPDPPTNLTATAISSAQVDLAWTDNAINEVGYVILRSDDSGVTWIQVGQTAADAIAFSDTSVSPASTYTYQVYAFNIAGNSLPATSAPVTTPAGPPPPVAPSGLSATNVTETSLTLNWVDNSTDETGFTVQIAADNGFATILQTITTGANVISWDFTGLAAGTPYYFRVQAFNLVGPSAWSAPLAVTTSPLTIPAAPSNLTTANKTQTSITLNWVDNSNNEAGFTVQIATNNTFTANFQTITTGANVISWDFTGLTQNTKYYFRAAAFNAAGVSPWAPTINDKTLR